MTRFKNHDITHDPVHVIYRLENSFSKKLLVQLRESYQRDLLVLDQRMEVKDNKNQIEKQAHIARLQEAYQHKYDLQLHKTIHGPNYLNSKEVKRIVIDDWLHCQSTEVVEVYAISVMSNHVHVLFAHADPWGRIDFLQFMALRKRYTARRINSILNRRGRLWARKAFDRTCRKNKFGTVFHYVINNPVKAGLTNNAFSWEGNYINPMLM